MTPDQFLASNPADHPDFVGSDQPANHPRQAVLMPNLVALIQRMGGLDEIPDQMLAPQVIPPLNVASALDEIRYGVFLRDFKTQHIYAELYRLGPAKLVVSGWHPHDDGLSLIFGLPTDWTVGAWTVNLVDIDDVFSSTADLDVLVATSCDWFIGAIQKATGTYCLIRRDQFLP
jgi:hypothetical protein